MASSPYSNEEDSVEMEEEEEEELTSLEEEDSSDDQGLMSRKTRGCSRGVSIQVH